MVERRGGADRNGEDAGPGPSAAGRPEAWRRRLASNRYPLAASVALFSVLFLAGALPAAVAILCVAAMLAVSVFLPVRTAAERQAGRLREKPDALDRARSEAVLDSLPDPVLVLDGEGTIRFANSAARRIFADTVRPGTSALIRFREPEMLRLINDALAGRASAPVELSQRSPIERWLEASVHMLPGAGEEKAALLLYFRDLSEVRRLDRMRSDFIANASHELRTPLASLGGFIETLAGPARDDAAARDRFLKIMQEQAERMSRLIDDLLSLSRLETAFGRSDFGPVNMGEVLHHVCSTMAPAAKAAGIELIGDFDAVGGPDCRVRGSRDELIQLFTNLVENAIRYGAVGKRVDITADRTGVSGIDSIRATVRDYGPGIAAEHIPRLTERFYRVDVDSSRAKKGTGLGLAIVRHIAARHLGRLSVASEVGKGAAFTVTLPVWNGESDS